MERLRVPCSTGEERERLWAAALEPASFRPVPARVQRDPFSAWYHCRYQGCRCWTRGLAASSITLSSPRDLRFLEHSLWAPFWCNTLYDYGGYPFTTFHHLLLTQQLAHLSASVKRSSSLKRDILSINRVLFCNIITLAINPQEVSALQFLTSANKIQSPWRVITWMGTTFTGEKQSWRQTRLKDEMSLPSQSQSQPLL